MRRIALAGVLLLATLAAAVGGITLNTAKRAEFTDCAAGGSSATTLVTGEYLVRITDSDVFVCFAESASTCAAGGEKFPQGTVVLLNITGDKKSVSCRSTGAVGDAIFTGSN